MALSKIWSAVLSVILAAASAVSLLIFGYATGYSGTVTAEGKPLAGVSVTDGRNVVKTDENGRFHLRGYRKTRFITVTVPAGYAAENYYISADRGKKDGYDFELVKSDIAAGQAHSFIQISDTEVGEKGVGEWINYLKAAAAERHPAFIIHTGDICYIPGLNSHIKGMNTENMGVPVRYVIGNHDYVDGKYGEELFESIYGPVWYSFEVGNVHYAVTSFQTGGDYRSRYDKNDRWRWLENDLANTDEDMKVVIFNHNKPQNDDYVISFDRKELDLKRHNLIAWVFGHYHYNYIEENHGVMNISTARPDCGGIDSSVSGARVVNISDDGTVTTDMIYYDFGGDAADIGCASWSAKLDGNVLYCDTVVDGGRVYVATVDENVPRSCGIYCLDAASGGRLWSFKTKNSVKNKIIVDGGYLYAQDCEGNVYCLDAVSGKAVWTAEVSLGNALDTSSGICLADGLLYTGCAAGVTALNSATGEKVWENIRNYGESSPAEFIVAGDKLIVSSHWEALIALDKNMGREIWKNRDDGIRFRSSTPALLNENTLIVADSGSVMLVDLGSGKMIGKFSPEGYNFSSSGQPLCLGGTAVIPTANRGVVFFDAAKGEITGEFLTEKAIIFTAPYIGGDAATVEASPVLLGDGSVLIGASDGKLYRISAGGELLGSVDAGAPIFGSPAVSGGSVYFSDFSGRVTCISLDKLG